MSAAQLELPTVGIAVDGLAVDGAALAGAALAFGAVVAALIPARTGPRTPGAESIDRMHAWAAAQGADYLAALRTASRGDLLRIGHALTARGLLPPGAVPTCGDVGDARDEAWGAGWNAAPEGASRAQRADAAKRAQERHDAETIARLRRDVTPGIAAALERWASQRDGAPT